MSIYRLAILSLTLVVSVIGAQDKWVWTKSKNQKVLGYYPSANKKVYYTEDSYARADKDRDREPTTRRPLPGEVANDEIEDYNDENEQPPTRQNSPYLPGDNFGGAQPAYGAGSGYGGFNQYPQYGGPGGVGVGAPGYPGHSNPGILVGPGGPTGIIGRPPSGYPGQVSYPGYPAYNTQNFLGPTNPNTLYNGGVGQFAGPTYPNTQQQQFGGPQYPIAPSQQYPVPVLPPQFTEGYGLSTYQPGNGYPTNVAPQQNFNGYSGYGGYPGLDEYVPQFREKSASVKNNEKRIDDKVVKNLKNS
ncbi:uncharacterized protein LOC142232863 [Haematobia irritans]|uniref:uncharacterized protein LOC142232863 n=1 Tax=Haematobia irritans TaxID=7368 RepID=UPI003F50B5D0